MHPNEVALVMLGKSTRLPIPTPELDAMTYEAHAYGPSHQDALSDQIARQYRELKGGA